MTTVPLETPGADEADLKAALGTILGLDDGSGIAELIADLPTFDPGAAGLLWYDAGLLKVSAGAPGWLPAGAIAYADFVNGNYYGGGQVRTIGGLFYQSEYGSFDPPAAPSQSSFPTFRPSMIGDFVTAGGTIFVEYESNGGTGYAMASIFDLPSYSNGITISATADEVTVRDYDADGPLVALGGTAGTYRLAATVGGGAASVSVNGGAVVNVASGVWFAPTHIAIEAQPNDGTTMSSIAIFPPRPDVDLPVLSAL